MGYEDIPDLPLPLPISYEDFRRPVLITKEYYDKLPEYEKCRYVPLNQKDGKEDEAMDRVHNTMQNPEIGKRKPPQEIVSFIKIIGKLNGGYDSNEHHVRSDQIVNITTTPTAPYACIVTLKNTDVILSSTTLDEIMNQVKYVVEE